MTIEMWLAFTFASTILLIIPGPTILTVISYSVSHGYRAKIPLIIAVALGDSTALALSLLGLGALLAESAFWFQIVKWAGGLYLLFLGVKLLKAGIKPSEIQQDTEYASSWMLFINTYLVTALNPKGIIFFVAFLIPISFTMSTTSSAVTTTAVPALIFSLIGLFCTSRN